MTKIVVNNQSKEILGASIVGHAASEVIHEVAMSLRFHATITDFTDLIHVYPSIAESLKAVAKTFQ